MRLLNIASGSSGNSTYIGNDNTHILVDCGISRKRINEGLKEADIELSDISAILITHEHIDHIGALGILARTKDIPIYATKGTIEGISDCSVLGEFNKDLLIEIEAEKDFLINDIAVKPISISHDANDPVCFKFESGGKKAAIVTDLGRYDEELIKELAGMDVLMMEANHDVNMLEVGPYPYPVKQRILGSKGHLSNEDSGRLISRLLHDNIKQLILAHISRENNTRDLAKVSVEAEIDMADNKYKAGDFRMSLARHDIVSEIFVF